MLMVSKGRLGVVVTPIWKQGKRPPTLRPDKATQRADDAHVCTLARVRYLRETSMYHALPDSTNIFISMDVCIHEQMRPLVGSLLQAKIYLLDLIVTARAGYDGYIFVVLGFKRDSSSAHR